MGVIVDVTVDVAVAVNRYAGHDHSYDHGATATITTASGYREIAGKKRLSGVGSAMVFAGPLVAQYIDLHCHILPGLDDGAPDLATSMEILRALQGLGFAEVCATPHQRNGLFIPTEEAIAHALSVFQGERMRSEPEFRVRLGAENYWDEILVERLRKHTVPCYDGRRAFLFEVNPVLMPPHLDEALFEIRLGGCLPVMAHPERYLSLQRDLGVAEALGKQAALVVDLEALAGGHNRAETKTARRLVEEGLAHAAASDMHDPDTGPAVASGIAWIKKHLGSAGSDRLLEENPRRILVGELP